MMKRQRGCFFMKHGVETDYDTNPLPWVSRALMNSRLSTQFIRVGYFCNTVQLLFSAWNCKVLSIFNFTTFCIRFWSRNVVKRIMCYEICLSFRLSVRLSVTLVGHACMSQDIEICFARYHWTISLVSWGQNFAIQTLRFTTNECVKNRHPLLTAKIWPMLLDILETIRDRICQSLLLTNRKSHTGFRLAPKVVPLSDLEPRNGRYFASFYPKR